MKTTGTFSRSIWVAMALLVSTFIFGASSASAQCALSVTDSVISLDAKADAYAYTVIVVENTSTEKVAVVATITGADAKAFSLSLSEFSIEGKGKKEVKVKFLSSSLLNSLRATASLNLATGGAICKMIPLIGIKAQSNENHLSVDPSTYAFPSSHDSGKQVCKDFTVTNVGTAVAYIQGWTLNTDSKSYTLSSSPASVEVIQPGATVKITLCFTQATSVVAGSKGYILVNYSYTQDPKEWSHLTISFSNNGNDDPNTGNGAVIDPSKYSFPVTEIGKESCKEFTVINKGTTTLYIPSWMLSTDSKDFSTPASTTDVKEVAPGQSLTIKVCYTPTTTAHQSGYLVVSYSFTKDPKEYSKLQAFFSAGTEVKDTTKNSSCVGMEPKDGWKTGVLLGGSEDRILILANKTQSVVAVTGINITGEDAKAFILGNITLPASIPVGGSIEIPYTFKPYAVNGVAKEKYYAGITFTLDGSNGGATCGSYSSNLLGYSLKEHKDDAKDSSGHSVAIPISTTEKQTIGLSNRGIEESYTLLFVNNLNVDVTVQSLSMKEGTYYTITATNPSTTPFIIKPNETFTVTISFKASDGLVHKDALVIVADHNITSTEIGIEGINYSLASVKGAVLPEGVSVSVNPVPAKSDLTVTIAGIRSANIEVIDILGNTIATATTTGEWKWNGQTSVGSAASNGAYIVRIAGMSNDGSSFVTSKRVIIAK